MFKRFLILGLVVTAVLGFSSCNSSSSGGYSNTNPTAAPSNVPVQAGKVVSISNFAFDPASLTIKVGETVIWTNNDSVGHNIAISSLNLVSPTFAAGGTFSQMFNSAGTYDYSCGIHPSMKGTIVVQ
ncbi:MAG: cupredoxin family copper-binding protein [Bacillota bacterium]